MALADVVVQREDIIFKGGHFTVHGITYDVINRLLMDGHREEVQRAIDSLEAAFNQETGAIDQSNLVASVSTLITEMPVLAARLIAYSANEPDHADKVRDLSLPVQLDAVLAICRLTFDGEDSIKKFVGNLIEILMMTRRFAKPSVEALNAKLAGMKA